MKKLLALTFLLSASAFAQTAPVYDPFHGWLTMSKSSSGGGSGTVTSVSGPSWLTWANSTTTPTATVASQTANYFLAAPNGSAGAATFRAIVGADLNITPTTCTAPQVVTALSASGVGTCTAPVLTENSQSAAYTTVLADAGKMIYHPGSDTTARTFTIDSNANVAFPIGTCVVFVNDTSAGTLTIAITSDTLVLFPGGTTGSRTLTASNVATACKVGTTRWFISGSSGLT